MALRPPTGAIDLDALFRAHATPAPAAGRRAHRRPAPRRGARAGGLRAPAPVGLDPASRAPSWRYLRRTVINLSHGHHRHLRVVRRQPEPTVGASRPPRSTRCAATASGRWPAAVRDPAVAAARLHRPALLRRPLRHRDRRHPRHQRRIRRRPTSTAPVRRWPTAWRPSDERPDPRSRTTTSCARPSTRRPTTWSRPRAARPHPDRGRAAPARRRAGAVAARRRRGRRRGRDRRGAAARRRPDRRQLEPTRRARSASDAERPGPASAPTRRPSDPVRGEQRRPAASTSRRAPGRRRSTRSAERAVDVDPACRSSGRRRRRRSAVDLLQQARRAGARTARAPRSAVGHQATLPQRRGRPSPSAASPDLPAAQAVTWYAARTAAAQPPWR